MAEPPRRRFRLRLRTLLLLTLLGVVGLSLYSYWSDYRDQATRRQRELLSPARGANCTVILRGDAAGPDAASTGVPWKERKDDFITGEFYLMNDQWIVIDAVDGAQQWIPREHVLMLRVEE